ncbi:C40 family peptidase [Glycomyces xiaoerkulensis]|uniref:C40 family peptidase n=1 Tax=Glycomyces xiaoerkulensis TaxID=2038139 RepID=UPI0012FFE5A7|nr:C40 family peptidase [Glycomyces xiaoerkulensis]
MRTRQLAAALTAAVLLPASGAVLTASQAVAEPSPEEVEAELDERHSELELVIEDYNAKNEELEDAEDLIAEIEDELPELEEAVAESSEQVADIVAAAHTNGDFAMVNSVLSGDPTDFADRLTYLQNLSDAENARLQAHVEEAAELQARKDELEALTEDADEIMAELEEQQEEIEAEIADLEVLLDQVTPEPDPEPAPAPSSSGGNSAVVDFAYAQLGEPYVYGSAGPDSWDCSGLVQQSWAAAGYSLSHNVEMQWNEVARISKSELQPGDIVFYSGLGHNALYIGDEQIIHAPRTGKNVEIVSMYIMDIGGYGRP